MLAHEARFWAERVRKEDRSAEKAALQSHVSAWQQNTSAPSLAGLQRWHERAKNAKKGGFEEAEDVAHSQSALHAMLAVQRELQRELAGLGGASTGAAGQRRRHLQSQLAVLERVENMTGRQPADRQVREAFRRFDANSSGRIDVHELRAALALMGVDTSEKNAEAVLRRFDENKSGLLDVNEFAQLVHDLRPQAKAPSPAPTGVLHRSGGAAQPWANLRPPAAAPDDGAANQALAALAGSDRRQHPHHHSRRDHQRSGDHHHHHRHHARVPPPTPPRRGANAPFLDADAAAGAGGVAGQERQVPPRIHLERQRSTPSRSEDWALRPIGATSPPPAEFAAAEPRGGRRHAQRRDAVLSYSR